MFNMFFYLLVRMTTEIRHFFCTLDHLDLPFLSLSCQGASWLRLFFSWLVFRFFTDKEPSGNDHLSSYFLTLAIYTQQIIYDYLKRHIYRHQLDKYVPFSQSIVHLRLSQRRIFGLETKERETHHKNLICHCHWSSLGILDDRVRRWSSHLHFLCI